jgi:prepilin-type N-terminal cleavage/methylation domain-containing protein/prepilin-type processing-associated H-X9-DG protein
MPRRNPHAFTLVELLVVIAIIAVLLGILLPTVSRARQQSVAVNCASNLHVLGQGFLMYAARNQGMLPPRSDTQPASGASPITSGGNHWYDYIGQANVLPVGTGSAQTAGYVTGVWRCPAVDDALLRQQGSFGWGGGYGPNVSQIFRYGTYLTSPPTRMGGVKMVWVKASTTTWLLGDVGRPTGVVGSYFTWGDTLKPPFLRSSAQSGFKIQNEQPATRHPNDTANVLFFDGHVDRRSFNQLNNDLDDVFATNAGLWFTK